MSDSGQLHVDASQQAQVHIRSFDPASDLDICQKIYQIARAAAFHWIDSKKFRLKDFSADIKGESIAVAEEFNRGGVCFVGIWSPEHFIHHLYVLPERHRRGIGKALFDHGLTQIGRPARVKCSRRIRNACGFWARVDWRSGWTGGRSTGDWFGFLFD